MGTAHARKEETLSNYYLCDICKHLVFTDGSPKCKYGLDDVPRVISDNQISKEVCAFYKLEGTK